MSDTATSTTLLGKRKVDESTLPSKSSKKISPILASIIEVIRTHKSSTGTSLQKILKDCSNQYSEKQIKLSAESNAQSDISMFIGMDRSNIKNIVVIRINSKC